MWQQEATRTRHCLALPALHSCFIIWTATDSLLLGISYRITMRRPRNIKPLFQGTATLCHGKVISFATRGYFRLLKYGCVYFDCNLSSYKQRCVDHTNFETSNLLILSPVYPNNFYSYFVLFRENVLTYAICSSIHTYELRLRKTWVEIVDQSVWNMYIFWTTIDFITGKKYAKCLTCSSRFLLSKASRIFIILVTQYYYYGMIRAMDNR